MPLQIKTDGGFRASSRGGLGVPPVHLMGEAQEHRRGARRGIERQDQAVKGDCPKMLRSAASLLGRGRRLGSLATEQTVRPTYPSKASAGTAERHMCFELIV